jgi:hypothetical protein
MRTTFWRSSVGSKKSHGISRGFYHYLRLSFSAQRLSMANSNVTRLLAFGITLDNAAAIYNN